MPVSIGVPGAPKGRPRVTNIHQDHCTSAGNLAVRRQLTSVRDFDESGDRTVEVKRTRHFGKASPCELPSEQTERRLK
jgi:hypothetical protein